MALENKPGYRAQRTSEIKLCYLDLHVWQLNHVSVSARKWGFQYVQMNEHEQATVNTSLILIQEDWVAFPICSSPLSCFSCQGLKLPLLNITQASMNSFSPPFLTAEASSVSITGTTPQQLIMNDSLEMTTVTPNLYLGAGGVCFY